MSKRIIPSGSLTEVVQKKVRIKLFVWSCLIFIFLKVNVELCCASREEHSFQKQYIDASNDERYGKVKESKTDADDFNPIIRRTLELSIHERH